MRILLLGEYSNVHATLATGLRELNHEVTVVSNGDFWKNYPRDVNVSRPEGPLGGLRLYLHVLSLLPRWRGYDVVQFINPMFLELRAERLFAVYRYLRKYNDKMVLCAMGMDFYWVSECTYRKPLRYSDFNIGNEVRTDEPAVREQRDWIGTAKERLNRFMANDCDGIVAGLYEDYVCYRPYFPKKCKFIPLPITFDNDSPLSTLHSPLSTPLKVFIGISKGRSQYKGTDIMLKAAEYVQKKYPEKMQLLKVEGVSFDQYKKMMNGSDAILDQLYSYTPSMNPLLAMSKGIICIGGGEPENYEILGEKELKPIINVQPCYESVCHELEQLVLHPERVPELKRQSVDYVRRHHDYRKVACQYELFYNRLFMKSD